MLGHALSMQAIQGGKAKNDTSDSHTMAGRLRGGLLPQASVYPAAMRATRELVRRRTHLRRKRAELLAPVQHTQSQDHRPALGKKIAYKAHRDDGAERLPAPAGHKSIEVALALLDSSDQRLPDLALPSVHTAQERDVNTFYRLRLIPGVGTILARVMLYASHDIQRFPRVPDGVSYGRLVKCAQASAGKRYGTSGKKIGNASLQWAFAEAAVLFLRTNEAGQKYLARLEKKHGKGQALTMLAPKLARAVYYRLKRAVAFDMATFLHGERRGGGEPGVELEG